jgi:hypothetical protein
VQKSCSRKGLCSGLHCCLGTDNQSKQQNSDPDRSYHTTFTVICAMLTGGVHLVPTEVRHTFCPKTERRQASRTELDRKIAIATVCVKISAVNSASGRIAFLLGLEYESDSAFRSPLTLYVKTEADQCNLHFCDRASCDVFRYNMLLVFVWRCSKLRAAYTNWRTKKMT